MGTTVAPHVQIQYARLEDALTVWAERDPARPHRRYELAATDAESLARQIAAAFAGCADEVAFELAEYSEKASWGE